MALPLWLLAGWLLTMPVQAQAPANPEAERLVLQLSDPQFSRREAAFQELRKRGPVMLPTLRTALKSSDPEIRRRAEELVPILERQVESEKALTPTKVKLAYQRTPLGEVLQDLGKQTRYRFQLTEKDKVLASRPVTLSAGEVPLWEAVDKVCQQAGVTCELGGPELLEQLDNKWGAAKGRSRQYAVQNRQAPRDNVYVFSEGVHKPDAGCTVGAVRCMVSPAPPQVEEKQTASGNRSQKESNQAQPPPMPPGAPVQARGGQAKPAPQQAQQAAGAGRVRQETPPPARDYGKQAPKDPEENRPVRTLLLQVYSEPKLQWRGPLQVRIEPLRDDKRQEIDFLGSLANRKNDPNNESVQVLGIGPNGRQVLIQGQENLVNDTANRSPGKQEVALHCRMPESPGKVLPVLRGSLLGQVQTPMEPVLEVPDVTKAKRGEFFKGQDDLQLEVIECTSPRKKQHRLVFELFTPGNPANPWMQGNVQLQVQVNNRFQVGGRAGGSVASPDFTVYDTQGRIMAVTGREERNAIGRGAGGNRITLYLESTEEEAKPHRLVHSASRIVSIEVPFEFKNVKLP